MKNTTHTRVDDRPNSIDSPAAATNKLTHTPLPWRLGAFGVLIEAGDEAGRRFIAHCGTEPNSGDANVPNAAFIVRAVNCHADMLEALKAVQSQCAGHSDEFSCRVWLIADAAIRRAEGR